MQPTEQQGQTYAISISTFLQHRHFQKETHADLFLKTLLRYREQGRFQLHGFAIMPDHVHLLITPAAEQTLPKCIQLIKGGYSFAARTLTQKEIWHSGYHEHRVRDITDYDHQLRYIANNPPAARLPMDYLYVHTHPESAACVDPCPSRLL
ncbi:transposase [Granulicella sp. 5B5]|uniref:REP-associated tyrosine transposase n=1 Tax=Granulicella sp. 5B5 TaxID=1617967 RepID=UPI0015F3B464|nr:transposase [Granulicella sp. 5B5]